MHTYQGLYFTEQPPSAIKKTTKNIPDNIFFVCAEAYFLQYNVTITALFLFSSFIGLCCTE